MTIRSVMGNSISPALRTFFHETSFTVIDVSPAFAYDSIAQWKTLIEGVQQRMTDAIRPLSLTDPRLFLQEREFIQKMGVCWRLKGLGALYEPDESKYSCHNPEQAIELNSYIKQAKVDILAKLHSLSKQERADIYNKARLRLNKHKGAPYFFPGADVMSAFAVHRVVMGSASVDEVERRMKAVAGGKFGLVQASLTRTQAASKETPSVTLSNGWLKRSGTRWGPKIRRVGAQPFMTNHLWCGVGALARTAMSMDPRNEGTTSVAMRIHSQYQYCVAIDLSSYDTTVSSELIRLFDKTIVHAVLDLCVADGLIDHTEYRLLIDLAERVNACPILLPPWVESEVARLTPASGQIRSGINLTSFMGTVINRCLSSWKLRMCGGTENNSVIINYGDDTLLFTNDIKVVDNWVKSSDALGFVTTIAPDATFLMRRVPNNYSYLGRMVMGCINNESRKEPRDVIAAAASIAVRHALLKGHPLEDQFFDILGGGRTGMSRFDSAVRLAASERMNAVSMSFLAAAVDPQILQRTDYLEDLIQKVSLLSQTNPSASRLMDIVSGTGLLGRTSSAWLDFRTTASQMPLRDAEKYIRDNNPLQRSF